MNYKVPTHPFSEAKLFVSALNHNLSRTLVKGASENGRKNTAKSNPYWRILPAADYGHKNNTPSECAAAESYSIHERLLKNGTTIRRSSTPVIVCTRYSVLRFNYLTKNGHIISLLSYLLNFFYYIMCNGKIQ